jgi:hypothetical protein
VCTPYGETWQGRDAQVEEGSAGWIVEAATALIGASEAPRLRWRISLFVSVIVVIDLYPGVCLL